MGVGEGVQRGGESTEKLITGHFFFGFALCPMILYIFYSADDHITDAHFAEHPCKYLFGGNVQSRSNFAPLAAAAMQNGFV